MTVTGTRVGQPRETLAQRFSTYRQPATNPSDLGVLIRSFDFSLRALNRSPKTVKSYTDTAKGLCLLWAMVAVPSCRNLLDALYVQSAVGRRLGSRQSLL